MGGSSPSTVTSPFNSLTNASVGQSQQMTGNLATAGQQSFTPNAQSQYVGGLLANTAGNLPGAAQVPGQQIAGFDPTQEAAMQQIYGAGTGLGGLVGQGQNAVGQGMWGTYQAGQGLTGADVGSFYNPMAGNITAQMQNIFGQQNAQTTGNAAKTAGGVGASRIGVAQGNLANQQALAAGQTYAGLYLNALQAAQQQKQQQLAAGNALATQGGNAIQTGMGGLNAAYQTGATRQALEQLALTSQYQQQLGQYQAPYQQLAAQNAAMQGLGTLGGTTSQVGGQQGTQTGNMNSIATTSNVGQQATQYPEPSLTSQIAGLGGLAIGAAGLFLNRGGRTYARGGATRKDRSFARGGEAAASAAAMGGDAGAWLAQQPQSVFDSWAIGTNPITASDPLGLGQSYDAEENRQRIANTMRAMGYEGGFGSAPAAAAPAAPAAPAAAAPEAALPAPTPRWDAGWTPSGPTASSLPTAATAGFANGYNFAPGVAQNIPAWTGPTIPTAPGIPAAPSIPNATPSSAPTTAAPNSMPSATPAAKPQPPGLVPAPHLVPGGLARGGRLRRLASGGSASSILPYTPMTSLFGTGVSASVPKTVPGPQGPVNSDLSAITGDIQKFVNLRNLYRKAPFGSQKPGVTNQATPDISNYETQRGASPDEESPSNEYQEGGDVESQDTQGEEDQGQPDWGRMLGLDSAVPVPTPRPATFDERFGGLSPAQEDNQPANFNERFGSNFPSNEGGGLTGQGVPVPLPRPAAAGPGTTASPLPDRTLERRRTGLDVEPPRREGFIDRLSDPRRMALIQMGLGMAAASGQRDARGLPMSPLAVVGQGGSQGLQAFQTARAANLREQMERRRMAHEGSAEGRANKTLDEAIRWHNFQMSAPVKTGEDMMGRPTYSQRDEKGNLISIDTKGQRAEGAPEVEPGKAASLNGEVLTPGKNVAEGTNPEVLVEIAKEDPGMANTVRAIAEGRQSLTSVSYKNRTTVSNLVNKYDPSWNQYTYAARQKMNNELSTNGNAGKLILATNQLLPHIKTAIEQVDELDNSNYPAQNAITNWLYTQTGDPRVKKFNTVREVAAMDAARLLRGSGQMAEKDIEFWRETLAASSSPKQLKETLGLLADDLMGARMSSIEHQYRTIMGKEPPTLISPEARDSLTYIRKASGKGGGAGWATKKEGTPLEDGFTGRTATGKDGKRMREVSPDNWEPY